MSLPRPGSRGRSDGGREPVERQEGADRRAGPVLVTLVGDEPLAPLVLARQVDASRVVCLALPVVEWRVEPLLALLRRDGRAVESYLPAILDVPAGIDELDRLIALDDGERVVFDLTNARGVLGFSLYELARRYEAARRTGAGRCGSIGVRGQFAR